MHSWWSPVGVVIALMGSGAVLLNGCGGATDGGVDGGKDGGVLDATPDRVGSSCEPRPGCTSTTTCPSDCNTCTCVDGTWACTLLACNVGSCCPPDPQPACCMQYGGWSSTGACGKACDGMPTPGDPAWHMVTDAHGCSLWSSQGSTGPLCGEPIEGGPAGPADASRDTGACVSPRGGRCGGNTANPCSCASGLVCAPGDGGLPFGDVGGTCAVQSGEQGDGAAADGDAPGDAAALDARGDGGLCEWNVDAGGPQRACPSGAQCCPGGAVGTTYCYPAARPCPAVP